MTEGEAERASNRNVITRSIGTEATVAVDLFSLTLAEGDRLLLCSDGLHALVRDERIEAMLERGPASSLPQRLVKAANDGGGRDNISVVVAGLPPPRSIGKLLGHPQAWAAALVLAGVAVVTAGVKRSRSR